MGVFSSTYNMPSSPTPRKLRQKSDKYHGKITKRGVADPSKVCCI